MKNKLRVAKGLFIITILFTFLVSQELYAAEETLPMPEEIIAKNIEAMGGTEARKKIKNKKTVTIHKNVQMNTESKTTQYRERPNNFCQSGDGGVRRVSNGKMAWIIHPQNGTRLLEGLEASIFLSGAKFDQPDMPYKSMKTEGIEQINGKDCYKVIKTPEKGTEKIVYYDKKSFLIVKTIDYFKHPQQGNTMSEEYIEGYKKIDNILFPYKVVHFINGQKRFEETTEKIELNIEMPEGIFDIPEEIKSIMNKNEKEPHSQQ